MDEFEDWWDIFEYGGLVEEDIFEEELRVNLLVGVKLLLVGVEIEEEEEDYFDWELEGGKKKE